MMSDLRPWHLAARDRLLELRGNRAGWGYDADGVPYSEPTVLTCLALLAADGDLFTPDTLELVDASAQFLTELQQPDGAVGIAEDIATPCWPTAFAALLWSQLPSYRRPLADALRWLQQREPLARHASDEQVLSGDMAIGNWPSIGGIHSRTEPSGLAILALCRNQLAGHRRIADGVRWLLDRSLPGGGWTLENTEPWGQEQDAHAGPTGIMLLALRAAGASETVEVTRACHYLMRVLPEVEPPEMLSWGLLGYSVWRARPARAEQWLRRSYENAPGLADSPARLAMLVLAASPATFSLLGVGAARAEKRSGLLEPPSELLRV
ncbi:MAG: prenyltransferase/squalene oxidase repeat-containing protein [Pirellulaceae bacterium]